MIRIFVVISKKSNTFAGETTRNRFFMKKIIATLLVLLITMNMHAVLKEKNLEQTLSILRTELTQKHQELNSLADQRAEGDHEAKQPECADALFPKARLCV